MESTQAAPTDSPPPSPSTAPPAPASAPDPEQGVPSHPSMQDAEHDPEVEPPQAVLSSACSNNSDHQLGHSTTASSVADPDDRVFPIRSVVSVDQSQPTPFTSTYRNASDSDHFSRRDSSLGRRRRPSYASPDSDPPVARRADTVPVYASAALGSPSDGGDVTRSRRKHTLSGISISDYITSPPPRSPQDPPSPSLRPQSSDTAVHPHQHQRQAGLIDVFPDDASDISATTRDSHSIPRPTTGQSEAASMGRRSSISAAQENLVTVRFQHVLTDGGHAVITGRDGTLQRCEDEPIHAPGAVQSFGLLVALREETDGRLTVRYVSENCKTMIGYTPQELFKLSSFVDIFSEEQSDNLQDHIDFVRDEEADPATNGPDVFSISVRPPRSKTVKLWCAMHINDSHPDLVICEFELEDDHRHPLRPPDETMPETPEDTLYQNPTAEELHESTENQSKPLRVLRTARKRRGEAGAMQVFDIMSQVQEQLASAPNLDRFLKTLVGVVKELTGFHRVMVYQFDSSYNGKVVTELVDTTQTRDLYHGLHFPASDIPKQARDLYKLNKVRLLYDRDLESSRLVCRSLEDLEQPLDLSHSYLRAMSPIHVKYLANMAVRSSMSISINAFNELWGLVSCHSYGNHGMRVPFPIRKMCRLVGDTASRNIERLSYASRLQARKLINTVPTDKNPSGYIIASSEDLLTLFDADYGVLSIRGETKILGRMEQSQEALAMLEYLRLRCYTSVLTSHDIREDFPDLRYPPGFSVIAGLLYVPLSAGGQDFIVFFRRGQIKQVKWAGNPYEKLIREGTSEYLEPRSSFKEWHETVIGKCREWSEEQVETAAVLCLVYGKFIEVWRQKEAALQSSRLTRLLLANSAHEVRTPLNAIINYLEIALEGSLDQETRENLARSHSASKSLIYVINDLLDLTKTEEGQLLVKDEVVDLPTCIREATDPFKGDAARKGIEYEVIEPPGLPRFVHGDYRRVRQAVANMTANAMQHTSEGSVKVKLYVTEVLEKKVRLEIVVQDTGCGMSKEQLDNLFEDLEQVSTDTDESGSLDTLEKPRESRTLGLGLAVVSRIVRNMDGQLRLKSEEGKGSRFVVQLPFELPSSDVLEKSGVATGEAESSRSSGVASVSRNLPPADAKEMTLVDRGASTLAASSGHDLARKASFEDAISAGSTKSGISRASAQSRTSMRSTRSDADRLIDAIQTPLALGDADIDPPPTTQRRGSRGHISNTSASSVPGRLDSPDNSGRPQGPQRSLTGHATGAGAEEPEPGSYPVADMKTPIKPVRIPDKYKDHPETPNTNSGILFEMTEKTDGEKKPPAAAGRPRNAPQNTALRVLVAEDDPINMKILKKRLEKSGHTVNHSVNGEDCASSYRERTGDYDVILMDMQMPIVDGLSSTKMIRAYENSIDCGCLSPTAQDHGRIPIFAVSASLVERDRDMYVQAGFDGWILKPIDFKRLNVLLEGINKDDIRQSCLYEPGEWERGGWLVGGPIAPENKA